MLQPLAANDRHEPTLVLASTRQPVDSVVEVSYGLVISERVVTVSGKWASGALVEDREMAGFGWSVMTDPERNEFCIAASGAR